MGRLQLCSALSKADTPVTVQRSATHLQEFTKLGGMPHTGCLPTWGA